MFVGHFQILGSPAGTTPVQSTAVLHRPLDNELSVSVNRVAG